MANDFSGDASCKALWRFEAGGLTTDSKSTNTLTNNGATEETTNHMEGSCAAALASASSQNLSIADGSLASGFPLKSGDTTKIATFAFWFRPTTLVGSMISKWNYAGSDITLNILINGSKFRVTCAHTSGQSSNYYDYLTLTATRKYHAVVSLDGVNKLLYVWIYDNTAGVLYTYVTAMTNVLRVGTADLGIGCEMAATKTNFFNGVIDEVVVLNRLVSSVEAGKIRLGTYSAENNLDVLAVHAYVEYQRESKTNISQVIAEVEWLPTDPNTHIYSGSIPIAITPQGTYDPVWEYAGSAPIVITVGPGLTYFQAPGQFEYHSDGIVLSVLPKSATAQGHCYRSGGVPLSITPQADVFCPDRFYDSLGIPITITPAATYRIPVPGVDDDSGYGAADLSFLDGPPPYYVIMGGLQVSLSPLASSVVLYAETTVELSGSVEAGGELGFSEFYPEEVRLSTSGGVDAGGGLGLDYEDPGVSYHTLSGGVEVGGKLGISHIGFAEIPITYLTTSRGVKVAGAFVFELVGVGELETLHTTITLDGGVAVGEVRRPPILVVDPGLGADETVLEFATHGTIFAGGTLGFDIPTPGVYEFELTRAGVRVGGALTFGFWEPPSIEIELSGGVMVEGAALAEEAARFETWVLNGFYFEPSIYGNFPFNSYAVKGEKCYAAGEDGIYLLEGGDDAGRPIHPGVRVGPTNFGFANHKRLRAIYPGKKAGTPDLRVLGNNGEESFCRMDDRTRFSVSQKVQDEVLTMEISDFTELSHIEFVPVIKAKR